MICIRCNSDLESGATTEHAQLQLIADWLCEVTCIKWRRGWLGQKTSGCDQYGVIDIESSSIAEVSRDKKLAVYEHEVNVDANDCPARKVCQIIDQVEELQINLIVINDQGDKAGCEALQGVNTRTSMDVLRHIRTLTYSDHPPPQNIEWIDRNTWSIQNTLKDDKDGNPCEMRSEMLITVRFCQKISIPIESNVFSTCQVYSCNSETNLCEEQHPECEE